MEMFNSLIKNILTQYDFTQNPFFVSLKNGEMTEEKFIKTQYQFYYAVINFTAPLALTAGAIDNYEDRVSIIKNLWEEHGEGNLSQTHGETFTEFMRRLIHKEEVIYPKPEEAVTLFNQTLNGICRNSHYLKSVAVMGMIECMFSDISSFIGLSMVERGFLEQSQVVHYSVHQDLDVIHAEDFFKILKKNYQDENKQLIEEGLKLGALIFLQLYHHLWERERVR